MKIIFYNHAYFMYNISMIVKKDVTPIDRIRKILKDQNGLLLTSDLSKLGIPRTYLSTLLTKGEIQRISRGVYAAVDSILDEMAEIQARYRSAIFSHETALYLLELTDRTPLFYSVTVPAGYNASQIKAGGAKVYFVKRELHLLGAITIKSPHGNNIRIFNLERTLCDVFRNRNQMDIHFMSESLKKYVTHPSRNIDQLYQYASLFRVQKIVRDTIEVLL